jgi:hypothetical protein
MRRSLFLTGLAAPALLAATPRLAGVASDARVRIVRRPTLRRGAAGGCVNHRVKARWSSFTAADFHPHPTEQG